jgi:hypothetical protein
MASAPGQPIAVTPIAVGTLSAATPVQAQGYPSYSPEYYPGYDPYDLWSWGWGDNLTGDYVWSEAATYDSDGLRPLNSEPEPIAA